jgi:predicted  nucleic acid-binding Zn-ribbon protein
MVNDELRVLWDLRGLDERVVHLVESLRRHPETRREAEAAIAGERTRLVAHQQKLVDLKAERRRLEQDIEALAAEERRFQSQLPLIKKNDEYQALLHEIADRKARRSDVETQVLIGMEDEQKLAAAQSAIEKALAQAESEALARTEAITATEQRDRAELESLEAARAELLPKLPSGTRTRYERIRESRGGRAVAALVKGACGGCFRGQPPHVIQEARRGDRVLVCDGCGRILVHPPEDS